MVSGNLQFGDPVRRLGQPHLGGRREQFADRLGQRLPPLLGDVIRGGSQVIYHGPASLVHLCQVLRRYRLISFPATRLTSRTYSSEPDSIEQQAAAAAELRSEVDGAGDEVVDAVRETAARLADRETRYCRP